MNEKMVDYKNKTIEFWQGRTKRQQSLFVSTAVFTLIVLLAFMWFGSRVNHVPLYTNLTVQETGEIKSTLDARGISSQIGDGGTSILVPEAMLNDLKVSLAAEGVPRSGRIDYSTFRDNMGFGTTENEFNLLERAAIQTSLEDLIRNIEGVSAAQVMITLPEESIWLSDDSQQATASVVLNIQPGYRLDQNQVRALYHLVSKSVPSLPVENILIMDNMSQHLELHDESGINNTFTLYEQQRQMQRDIERDIQRQVQQMLGTLVGLDKVLVFVSTDVDFTQENRQEQLVTPVDEESMSGIAVSIERITETFTGDDAPEGGIPGTGETDIPGYPGVFGSGGSGDYERMEERINNDFNRIQREIVESPYKIRDIGIQVIVEPPIPNDPTSLPIQGLNDIQQILGQIVRTSIDQEYSFSWEQDDIDDRIYVTSQEFFGKVQLDEPDTGIPYWYFIVGVLIVLILLLLFLLFRKGNSREEEMIEETKTIQSYDLPNLGEEVDSEGKAKRRQLEKLAREKPEEFSKLVRTWLSED